MSEIQQPDFDCLDVKLLDFIMAMCTQHSELKRKVEKNNLSHKSEMTKIKHRINMMENFLKVMTVPQVEQAEDFREGQKTSKAIISAYADMHRKFTENLPDVNGNGDKPSSCGVDNKQVKWNVEAVERLLKEVQLAADDKDVVDGKEQSSKITQIEDLQNVSIAHFIDCPPSQLPKPKPRNGLSEFEKGRYPATDNSAKVKDWTTVTNVKRGTTPLKHQWTFWVFRKNKKYSYEDNLLKGSNFSTWDHFTFSLNSLKSASDLQCDSKYIVFKSGHKPIFDDPINIGGGKWVMIFQKKFHGDLNNRWRELLLCMVGGAFGENGRFICGAEVSVRKKVDKISIWIIRGLSQERAWNIRKMIQDRLFVDNAVSLKYHLHPKTTTPSEGLPDFCF